MERKGGLALTIAGVPVLIVGFVFGFVLLLSGGAACGSTTGIAPGSAIAVDPLSVPEMKVAGYGHEQMVNAAWIAKAAADLGLSSRDQVLAIQAAMGESSLRVLDYGDQAGPDSRGLFQQRGNGAWGSLADRMDPYISSTNFLKALMEVTERDSMTPTAAIHEVQRNSDPFHYEKYWEPAVEVLNALAGKTVDVVGGGGAPGAGSCKASAGAGAVGPNGWALPAQGPMASEYGMRYHPTKHIWRLHAGTDIGAGCDAPIYAANKGTVTYAGFGKYGTNGLIVVDHGGGVETYYVHMWASGINVREGQMVAAGERIGLVGSSGDSTGCHLHFEVHINGDTVDPAPFMRAVGVPIG